MVMIRPGILVAAAVVLAADAWMLWSAARNRSGSPTSVIELTERELRLVQVGKDSTALLLRFEFDRERFRKYSGKFEDGPGWFDKAKLEQVGFDCRRPPDDPASALRYRSMPDKEVFVVLEYKAAAAAGTESEGTGFRSRLSAVDVGLDPGALRRSYPETRRFLITRGLARLRILAEWDADRRSWRPGAYLRGTITDLLVNQVNVPRPHRAVLDGLQQTTEDYYRTGPDSGEPRYNVVLHYGRNFEPFVASCRLLSAGQQ
ncbi:MAG: DUF4824 family protein [Acidobacteriia bacterium]|nr:DUF4824 family protein [Terriglobia bacterium]